MTRFNIDCSTARRLTGWAFDDGTLLPVPDLALSDGRQRHVVTLNPRADVAAAFSLLSDRVGFDLIVPDFFDGTVQDYVLLAGETVLFSHGQGMQAIAHACETSLEPDLRHRPPACDAAKLPNYGRGRHVLFIHAGHDALAARLRILQEQRFRHFFPSELAGCTISHLALSELDAHKKSIVGRLDEFLLVCPSELSVALHRVSPSLFGAKRFVTLYEGGSLCSRFGIHALQLNNFIAAKGVQRCFRDPWMASIAAVWSAVENYASVIFAGPSQIYFMARDEVALDPRLTEFARTQVQGHRSEDVVRLRCGSSSLTLVNFSAYLRIFDALGGDDCWHTAVRRGLTHTQLEI
ncbi:MAG: hypothetical protein QE285_03090 [Aquabacterium sp.]|nr:hypothetical protein [Aquabacterium sp.]